MVKRSREGSDPLRNSRPASPEPTNAASSPSTPSELDSNAYEPTKLVHLDSEGGEASSLPEVMRCSLPPHRQTLSFTSFGEYEVHYNKTHVNRCSECRKNFPTPHFLDLHISENHNPLVGVLKDRGERTYGCFVEDCDRKCSTPQKRRMHLIDKHMFPKNYDFYVVNDGIDQRSSMLRSGRHRRRSSAIQHKADIEDRARRRAPTIEDTPKDTSRPGSGENGQQKGASTNTAITPTTKPDVEMDDLTGAMSALKFVPPSVKFGRSKGKGGFSRS